MELTGAQALIKCLEMEHVEVAFGMPGGAILPAYDPLLDSSIRHILVRHEQGAGHMAEGYAHVTGKPGVAIVTSGPAATNIVTPLMDAYMDSVPMVVITGQVGLAGIGTDAFQEADTVGITRSTTKHNELVTSPDDLPRVIREAFHIATTGRPGPVLVDVPKDVLTATMHWHWPSDEDVLAGLPGYRPTIRGHGKQVKAAAEAIASAHRPVLYIGGGVLKARGAAVLRELAERTGIPVVTTLMARGAFPDDHPQHLGMPGMHGNYTAVTAMQRSDLLITLGARFDDRVTGRLDGFAPDAQVIHVDIDPAELSKVRNADIPIVGDVAAVIEQIVHALERHPREEWPSLEPWWGQLRAWQERYPLTYEKPAEGGAIKPQQVIEALSEQNGDSTVIVSGVGQHQMWASQYYKFKQPYTWVNSGGLGTMGFSVPAAIGAKMGKPDSTVWAVDGDGCFQMTCTELITAAINKIPVKVALLNNSYLGMVRQWQELFYGERYSSVDLGGGFPDFVKLSEAMGCAAFRVTESSDVATTIDKANGINDRPVVVEFAVEEMEKVYPMVPAGVSNDNILVGPLGDRHATKEASK